MNDGTLSWRTDLNMKNINEEFDNLVGIVKLIAKQFGSNCEVVLHDLTGDYSHTIVAIENGHITSREVGGCGSNLGLEVLRGTADDSSIYNYLTQTEQGRLLRSSTMHIKDDAGKVIGAICINFDISELSAACDALQAMTMKTQTTEIKEVLANNVNDLLEYLIAECSKKIGKQVDEMTREDKIAALRILDEKGAFLVTKAGDRICEFLAISKFTLYNYLDVARKNGNGKKEPAATLP